MLFERDAQGRVTKLTDPNGNEVIYTYDTAGDLVAVKDLDGRTTTFKYHDTIPHYLDEVVDPLGRLGQRNEYDEHGRLIRVFDRGGTSVEFAHDVNSQISVQKNQLGFETTYVYDEQGNVTTIVDVLGGMTSFEFDEFSNLLSETDPLGNITSYTYDNRGNMLTETDALGNTTRFTYNNRSQVTAIVDALGNTTTNAYDAKGNLLTTTNAARWHPHLHLR